MAADGCASSSIQSYRRELASLTRGLGDLPLDCLTADRLNGYLTSRAVQMKGDGSPKQASTVNRAKSVIRAFFRWCKQTGLSRQNPAAHVRLACVPIPPARHFTHAEVGRFLGTIRRTRHPLAARDHALFATLAFTGIRLSEATRLQCSDIDLRHRRLVLRRTKGGRQETRPLPIRLGAILARHRRARLRPVTERDAPLFVGQHGRPLSDRAVQYRFAFWLRRARIRKELSVHSLRHTFGTILYRSTKDLVLVSRVLGHRDVKSTQRYAHVGDQALATAINRMW